MPWVKRSKPSACHQVNGSPQGTLSTQKNITAEKPLASPFGFAEGEAKARQGEATPQNVGQVSKPAVGAIHRGGSRDCFAKVARNDGELPPTCLCEEPLRGDEANPERRVALPTALRVSVSHPWTAYTITFISHTRREHIGQMLTGFPCTWRQLLSGQIAQGGIQHV